jgi:hypothetical protein
MKMPESFGGLGGLNAHLISPALLSFRNATTNIRWRHAYAF